MAAQLSDELSKESELIQSTGGVFEVEFDAKLVFSKKKENRFPEEGEVAAIVKLMEGGKSLDEAQKLAAENAPKPPSFGEWFSNLMGG